MDYCNCFLNYCASDLFGKEAVLPLAGQFKSLQPLSLITSPIRLLPFFFILPGWSFAWGVCFSFILVYHRLVLGYFPSLSLRSLPDL